jgi:predicted nucleic acid-binding Zn ribbon protein
MTEIDTSVFYCYRCGNRVKRAEGNCWYCGAPNRRSVRPPRHCPFCGLEITQKAVKCPHCAEFLDGRARPAQVVPSGPPQHITFVIDKAVIQADKPLMLEGGGRIPPGLANLLSDQTVRAIQSNQPGLIDQEGVRALPMPRAAAQAAASLPEAIEQETEPANALPAPGKGPAAGEGKAPFPASVRRGGTDLVRPESTAPVVSSGKERALSLAKAGGTALAKAGGSALAKLTDRLMGAMESPTAPPPTAVPTAEAGPLDAEEVQLYRICTVCGNEVLADDNYCFHCGVVQRKIEKSGKPPMRVAGNTFPIFLLCVLLLGGMVYLALFGDRFKSFGLFGRPIRDVLQAAFSGFTFLLLAAAFFIRRTTPNQIAVIVFLVIWGLVSLAALIQSSFFS